MESWIANGKVSYQETVLAGIERAPEAFIGLFTGTNTGKMIVSLEE
jgi:NADPH-dependent curcumin reductase CurA